MRSREIWEPGFVGRAESQFLCISKKADHKGQPIRAAYEDNSRMTELLLLRELDQVEYLPLLDEDEKYEKDQVVDLLQIFLEAEKEFKQHALNDDDDGRQRATAGVGTSDVVPADHIYLDIFDIVTRIAPQRA